MQTNPTQPIIKGIEISPLQYWPHLHTTPCYYSNHTIFHPKKTNQTLFGTQKWTHHLRFCSTWVRLCVVHAYVLGFSFRIRIPHYMENLDIITHTNNSPFFGSLSSQVSSNLNSFSPLHNIIVPCILLKQSEL